MGDQLFDLNNLIVFAFIGLCIKLFFGKISSDPNDILRSDGSNGPATATVWGLGLVGLAVLGIMVLTFALTTKKLSNVSELSMGKFISGLLSESFPALFTLIIIIWIVTLNLTFYKQINQGRVSTEYYRFSNAATVLLIFQLIALLKYISGRMKGTSSPEQKVDNDRYAFAIYFVTFLNAVLVGITNIELKYFSTDG